MAAQLLRVKNWKAFQHYKERRPPWIKLYRELLDNFEWHLLSGKAAKALVMLWILASECDGLVPSVGDLAFRLRLTPEEVEGVLLELSTKGFLIDADTLEPEKVLTPSQQLAKANGFGSRYVSDDLKRKVWLRDGGRCRKCKTSEDIEYDHITPISKGGESTLENLQLLCRPCNRKKRVRVAAETAPDAQLGQEQPQDSDSPNPETEVETYTPKKEGKEIPYELLDQHQITPKLLEELCIPATTQNYRGGVAAVITAKKVLACTPYEAFKYIVEQAAICRGQGMAIDYFWLNDGKFFEGNRDDSRERLKASQGLGVWKPS